MSGHPPADLVVAHVTFSWPEAEVVASMLEAAGITVILADRLAIANNWHMAFALGGFRILVPAESEADAKMVIAQFQAAGSGDDLPESETFQQNPVRNSFWLLFSVFFGWCPAWLRQRGKRDG